MSGVHVHTDLKLAENYHGAPPPHLIEVGVPVGNLGSTTVPRVYVFTCYFTPQLQNPQVPRGGLSLVLPGSAKLYEVPRAGVLLDPPTCMRYFTVQLQNAQVPLIKHGNTASGFR